MLPIIWKLEARTEFLEIIRYIAEFSPQAARDMRRCIQASVIPAAEHPFLFREGRVPGTREIVSHPNYIVVYRVEIAAIEVVSVLHAREQYPPD
ncbi:type II toxin-antitoxin system RelE/ParE family toxin [Paraburkholderia tagetis]|uniref:Type II toxin-antitoxin system RelE/ParE family toxin n=1 Tax=Paraburkholderia tagetis TaxID=2913261 RepID=A0A9X1UKZ0_9BURK|nr:type II toxin-antitoxin system RelE/ParE family toxin [Paraburkholderia tagetis]MCG5076631.1 type II toxin-antitoxin system RelE/ParE family toxin [Paraburkholderia tagetis]